MNLNYLFSSPNPVDYSSPNPVDYSYLIHTNSEEHHPWSFSNTKLPMFNLGVDNSMSNAGQAGGSNAGRLSGPRGRPAGGSNAGRLSGPRGRPAGGSNAGRLSGPRGRRAGGSNVGRLSGTRPRGRPRGAKNKPKENVIKMTSPVRSAVLEIPPGTDVVEWVKQYAQSRNIFVNVLSGHGTISQVAYGHMLSPHPIILSETLTLISCTGIAGLITPSGTVSCSFTGALARLNGTVVGGMLRKLVTMEPVLLTVLISKNSEVVGAGYLTMA